MTDYYVDVQAGSDDNGGAAESPLKTLGRALALAGPGDAIKLRAGVYYEAVIIDKRGIVLEADAGCRREDVIIDGRYGPHLYGDGGYSTSLGKPVKARELPALSVQNARKGGWVSAGVVSIKGYSALLQLRADGVVVRGMTLRNAPGRFVVIEGNEARLEDCRMDFCYGGAVSITGGCRGAVVRGNAITRSSAKYHDPGAPGAGPDAVTTTVIVAGEDILIEANTVAYCYGEGISAAKGSVRPRIIGNTVFGNHHWGLGFNGTSGAVFEGNVVYWPDELHVVFGKDGPADCFVGGSEQASPETPKPAATPDVVIRRNLFVSGKRAFLLGGPGRPVQFINSIIEGNTVIGRATPGKQQATWTWTVLAKAPHENTVVRDNIILWGYEALGIKYQTGGEVTWASNLYNDTPPTGMRGVDDVVTRTDVLWDPFVRIEGAFDPYPVEMPSLETTFDIDNYRPLTDGPAARADGSYRGALLPAVDDVPEPPEPPEPDYGPIITALEGNLTHLEAAGMAVGAAVVETHELIDRLRTAAGYMGKESK